MRKSVSRTELQWMHLIDDAAVGASLEDIANWMMSGTPNRNIETRYLNYLHTVDPDLYHVAMRIGSVCYCMGVRILAIFWSYWICIARMEQNRWISFGNSNISTVELFNIASFMTGYEKAINSRSRRV